jgi:hypothetical protein
MPYFIGKLLTEHQNAQTLPQITSAWMPMVSPGGAWGTMIQIAVITTKLKSEGIPCSQRQARMAQDN